MSQPSALITPTTSNNVARPPCAEVRSDQRVRVAVLMTCHNRREKTLQCLRCLLVDQQKRPEVSLDVYLVDDGSTDGTSEAVRATFPKVTVLRGNGALYWNNGMRLAFAAASHADPDAYLWLNDDTHLQPHAVATLHQTARELAAQGSGPVIVVGSTVDAESGTLTYGGQRRTSAWHPFKYATVVPADRPQPCATMHGNVVWISRAAARRVGNLRPGFLHAMGDTDYGLRAVQQGCSIWVAPGFVATCPRNDGTNTWRDPSLTLRQRYELMMSPKGLPPLAYRRFVRDHAGPLWMLFWVAPYFRMVLSVLRSRFAGG